MDAVWSLSARAGRRRWGAVVAVLALAAAVQVGAAGPAFAAAHDQWERCIAQSSATVSFDDERVFWPATTPLRYQVVGGPDCWLNALAHFIVQEEPTQAGDRPQAFTVDIGHTSGTKWVAPMRSVPWRAYAVSEFGTAAIGTGSSIQVVQPTGPLSDNGGGVTTITSNSEDQRRIFAAAVQTPNQRVVVAGNVDLDVSGLEWLVIAPGVQLVGDHGARSIGPRLFTGTFPQKLFLIGNAAQLAGDFRPSDGVRISGIRFDGMESDDPCDSADLRDANLIDVYGSQHVEIDHNEFFHFRGSGVYVHDLVGDRLNRVNGGISVHDNFIHDNQHPTYCGLDPAADGHGGGYGAAVTEGGFASIERNVFSNNRHAIAGNGSPGDGYLAYDNLFLHPGVDESKDGFTLYNHQIDMHGSIKDCGGNEHWACGPAGDFMEVAYNTVVSADSDAIQLRGTPSSYLADPVNGGMQVHHNVFAQDAGDALTQTERGLVDAGGNAFGQRPFLAAVFEAPHDLPSCDFDGDGTADTVHPSGVTWWYRSSLLGRYMFLARTSAPVTDAILRDVNGDGRCDATVGGVVHLGPDAVVPDVINLNGSPIATTPRPDGGVEVFGTNVEDQVFHAGQTAPGAALGGWAQFDGSLRSIAAEPDGAGRINVAGIDSTGRVRIKWQNTPGGAYVDGWGDFGIQANAIAAARNADGRVELFAADTQGNLWHRYQTVPGGAWNWWAPMDGSVTQLAAQADRDGVIELFGLNAAGQVFRRAQTAPNSTVWTAWASMDGTLSSIGVALNKDGRMELFGANASSAVFHRVQSSAGTWDGSAWQGLDGLVSQVAAETDTNGRVALYAVNSGGYIFGRVQTTPGSWAGTGWTQIAGMLRPTHPLIPARPMELDPLYDRFDTAGSAAFPGHVWAQLGTAPYRWTVTGLPPGLALQPDLNITGVPTVPGVYPVTVSVTDHSVPPATITRSFTWTINPGPCWPGFNDHRTLAIPDLGTVYVDRYNGCLGNASAAATVSLDISHTYVGDLVIDLIAPSGRVYNLRNRSGGSAHNLVQTYTLDLSGEAMQGMWRLRIQDAAAQDSGQLNTWSLMLR